MTDPTPYEPAEGAAIYRADRVPDGYEWRWSEGDAWCRPFKPPTVRDGFVEARPIPEPLLAVMLKPSDLTAFVEWAEAWPSYLPLTQPIIAAARAALAEADRHQDRKERS